MRPQCLAGPAAAGAATVTQAGVYTLVVIESACLVRIALVEVEQQYDGAVVDCTVVPFREKSARDVLTVPGSLLTVVILICIWVAVRGYGKVFPAEKLPLEIDPAIGHHVEIVVGVVQNSTD